MKTAISLTCIGLITVVAAADASAAGHLCVGNERRCFATIQSAIDAARDGDVIRVKAGTFSGGITIDKSVTLVGSGARSTIIRGGGPVITIGEFDAPSQPTVTVAGVTITGGRTTSSPLSDAWVGEAGVIALGGGISIPPGEELSPGATVTIADSVISSNSVEPTATVPIGPPCPNGPCPFAGARGGGIDSWGALTLTNTVVRDNVVAGVASDAVGGGVNSWAGSVELRNSTVSGNRAAAGVPNGRYAEGGGIFTDHEVRLDVRGSVIAGNTATLSSELPFDVGDPEGSTIDMNANGAGIHANDGGSISIVATRLSGNTVRVDGPNGEPYGIDAALHAGSDLVLRDSVIEGNRVITNVGSTEHVGPSGGALGMLGTATVSHTRVSGNATFVFSADGQAQAGPGGIYGTNATIDGSVVSGNRVHARSNAGAASVVGAGILNEGRMTLRDGRISKNAGLAEGPAGAARGGGIWSGLLFLEAPPHLTLERTRVTGNVLRASRGLTVEGGGLFTAFPATIERSRIARNAPDQCVGC